MRNKKSKLFFNISMVALLASAIVTASVMTGCSSDNKDNSKETGVVHETEVATYEVNGVVVDGDGNILDKDGKKTGETVPSLPEEIKNKQNSEKSASGNSSSGNSSSASGTGKDKASSKASSGGSASSNSKSSGTGSQSSQSKASSNNQTSGGSSSKASSSAGKSGNNNSSGKQSSQGSSKSQSSSKKSSASGNALAIGNKKFNVGDTVVCTYNLQNASEKLLNYQGFIKYDGSYLKVKSAKLEGSASSGGLLNYDLNQEIRFNGSNLNGYNYTKSKAFVTVEYEVLKAGRTAPKINWEVITGLSEKKYCDDNGNLINGVTVTPNYSAQ